MGSAAVSDDKKTVRLSISSSEPYLRYDWLADEEYYEELDHSPEGVDLSRLKNGAALLYNHDRHILLGTLSNPTIENGRCYVEARMSEAADVASYKTKVEEGILKDTSIGYSLLDGGKVVGKRGGIPIYKFRFSIHEASLVTIPADISVGAGRQRGKDSVSEFQEITVETEKQVDNLPAPANKPQTRTNMPEEITTTEQKPQVIAAEVRDNAIKAERERVKKINDFVAHVENPTPDRDWKKAAAAVAIQSIENGEDFDTFRSNALNSFSEVKPAEVLASGIEVVGERTKPGGKLSLGSEFIRSKQFKEFSESRGRNRTCSVDYDMSALGIRGKVALAQRAGFTSSDLSAVNIQVQPGMVALGVQRLTIMDLIAPGSTLAAAIIYAQESTFGSVDSVAVVTTNGAMPKAGMVGERGLKPNWEPDLTTVTANVKKVAVTTKVPDEFMADFPGAQSFIDERMPFMVDTKTEEQVLYGDGIGNNLKGITAFAGVQTRAITTTSDATIAASLRQGLTDISVGSFFEPDGFAVHPYDWETMQLLKDTTGRFLAGGPYYIPYTNGVFMELNTFWGKPVAVTTAVAYGRPMAGAWKLGAQYFMREGMRLEATNANEDDFRRNLICIRAEHRLALACYRPSSFLEFTSFPARA